MVLGKVLAQQGRDGDGQHQRQQQRNRHHDAHAAQVFARFGLGEHQGHEGQDDGQRGHQQRHQHRAPGFGGGLLARLTQG